MRYLIYYLLFVSSTVFGQDSLRLVPVRAYILSRMIDEVKLGRSCDSALTATIKALRSTENSLQKQSNLLSEVTKSRDLWKSTSETKDSLAVNVGKQNDIDLKLGKKRARRTGFVLGVGIWVAYEAVKLFKP